MLIRPKIKQNKKTGCARIMKVPHPYQQKEKLKMIGFFAIWSCSSVRLTRHCVPGTCRHGSGRTRPPSPSTPPLWGQKTTDEQWWELQPRDDWVRFIWSKKHTLTNSPLNSSDVLPMPSRRKCIFAFWHIECTISQGLTFEIHIHNIFWIDAAKSQSGKRQPAPNKVDNSDFKAKMCSPAALSFFLLTYLNGRISLALLMLCPITVWHQGPLDEGNPAPSGGIRRPWEISANTCCERREETRHQSLNNNKTGLKMPLRQSKP